MNLRFFVVYICIYVVFKSFWILYLVESFGISINNVIFIYVEYNRRLFFEIKIFIY